MAVRPGIIFAYLGFDAVSTQAEEARTPNATCQSVSSDRWVICTVLYIAVSATLTGMVPYNQIDVNAPVAKAFEQVGLSRLSFWLLSVRSPVLPAFCS